MSTCDLYLDSYFQSRIKTSDRNEYTEVDVAKDTE